MSSESVTTAGAPTACGNEFSLWIGGAYGVVLTFTIDKHSKAFPPNVKQCQSLNLMIQGLARAIRAVAYQAANDPSCDAEFAVEPAEDIADAIMILSQLSAAIQSEAFEVHP